MANRALALLLTAALASPGPLALAQTGASPAAPLQSVDPETPARPEPATVLPAAPARALPATPRPRALPVPSTAPPTSIDDLLNPSTDVEPPGVAPVPPSEAGLNSEQLDMRIRGASAAAQALQGPMDGAWTLRDEQGAALYTFQFADPANNPNGMLEGAWRDLRVGAGPGGAGLISSIERSPGRLQASFTPQDGTQDVSVSLIQQADGAWTGQLSQGGGARRVRMIRTEPMLNVAPLRVTTGDVVSPYRTPASNTRGAPPAKAKKGKAARGKAGKRSSAKGGAKKASAKKKRR